MKKIINLRLALVVMIIGVLASCGTKKSTVSSESNLSALSDGAYLKRVLANAPEFEEFSSKMKFTLQYGQERISVGGSIKMVKDEVIQLSLVAIGIVEAAKIEITPKRILILDRIGRRYIDIPYKDFSFFAESDVDFYTLQSLFRNELFLPGVKRLKNSELVEFRVTKGETQATLTARENRKLTYAFLAALADGTLQKSQIYVTAKQTSKYQMSWGYADFLLLDGKKFPAQMDLSLKGTTKPVKAAFTFSRWKTEAEYEPVTIPNRYKEVEPVEILKHLLAL